MHALLEFASSLLAITAGIMILLHFITTGRRFFLIISIGFVLIGAEEFVHAIFSFDRIWSETHPTFRLAVSTAWLTGHFILLTSLFLALIIGEREIVPAKRVPNAVFCNIIGFICTASVTLLIFYSQFLPDFVQLGSITKKLLELSLALLFFVVFLFYANIYVKQQSHSPLLWSINACIIFQVLAHLFVFDSQVFYDSHWDASHLIIFLSYFFPIYGVWGETIKLQRLSQVQVIELEKEMTERKRAEEMLRRSEENFRNSLDGSPMGVRIVTIEGETIYANRLLLIIYGYDSLEEFRATAVKKSYSPESHADFLVRKERRQHGINVPSEYTIKIIRKDGEVRYLRVLRREILWDGERQFQVLYNDITNRKKAEEELRTSRSRLRALATRLQQIREEERVMIAREIHDEMGGGLSGLKMDLSWLLRKMGDADPGEERVALMDKIHTSNALIDQMIHVVRRISTDLRPSILDDLGLVAAIEWQLSEFTTRTSIPHELATAVEYVSLEEEKAVAVFRIFQEALTNVVRHSHATKVAVVLREGERSLFGDESLVLEIRDNGRGITEQEILNSESLGLLGMKERVLAFGGEISICGEPGGGTALVLKIPRKQGEAS